MKRFDRNYIVIIPVVLILCIMPIWGYFVPDHLVSETENRGLAQAPVKDLHHIKQYAADMESYVVEQFPGRETLLKAYTISELLQRKKLVRGTFVAGDRWLLPREFKTTPVEALSFAAALGGFADEYPDIPFFFAILPHKTTLLAAMNDTYISAEDGKTHHNYLLTQLMKFPQVKVLDVAADFQSLSTAKRKKLYFRTDFHWNAEGAFQAAEKIQNGLTDYGTLSKKENFTDEDFTFSELKNTLYQGDLNRRFSNLFSMKERIPIITPINTSQMKYFLSADDTNPVNRGDVIATGITKDIVSYNDIYTDNLGYYRVNNQDAKSDKCILILKDSLQNPTTDFFSVVFQEVDVIDARYYDEPYSIQKLIEMRRPDAILVMLHHDNYSQDLVRLLN